MIGYVVYYYSNGIIGDMEIYVGAKAKIKAKDAVLSYNSSFQKEYSFSWDEKEEMLVAKNEDGAEFDVEGEFSEYYAMAEAEIKECK